MVKTICKECKHEYLIHPYQIEKSKFCSRKCQGRWQYSKSKILLDQTGSHGAWYGKRHSNQTIDKISHSRKGKYSKSEHHNWKGGITPINEKIRKSPEYKKWRQKVFERDNFTCFFCGERGGKLNADHIKSFSQYPGLRFDVNNGRTVCADCHKNTETFGGKDIKRKGKIPNKELNKLTMRLIELTYKHNLSHLSSTLTSLPIIYGIFRQKRETEKFFLSNGHAGLALYVCLEHFYGIDANKLICDFGIHPKRDETRKIWASGGSLGCVLPIALGYAMVNPNETVYCLISDGEASEGSIFEALLAKVKFNVNNLIVYINVNGMSAYDCINRDTFSRQLLHIDKTIRIIHTYSNQFPFLNSIDAHYYKMTENDYQLAIQLLK
jgi:transketolase N-terminal domain/subunit